jgi:hypothetical protein
MGLSGRGYFVASCSFGGTWGNSLLPVIPGAHSFCHEGHKDPVETSNPIWQHSILVIHIEGNIVQTYSLPMAGVVMMSMMLLLLFFQEQTIARGSCRSRSSIIILWCW